MKEFFNKLAGFGRYPDLTRGAIFTRDRQYFDQILYKNQKFRHEYARAYAAWLEKQDQKNGDTGTLLPERIEAAIEIMGEPAIDSLFPKVLVASGAQYPENLSWRDTLPGAAFASDPANARLMEVIARFWQRLALPVVREEQA